MGLADTLAKLKGVEPVLKIRRGSEATARKAGSFAMLIQLIP
jgi:hypothetical protein